jgi:Tfp pilus assembly protein PilN
MRAVNLIPPQQRGGSSVGAGRSEGAAYAVVALLVGLAVMAVLYGSASHKISSDQGKAATISAQVTATQAQATALAPYTQFLAMREQRTKAVSELVATRFDWAHVFHEFARVLPFGVSISALDGTVGSTSSNVAAPAAAAPAAGATTSASAAATVTSATPPGSVPTFTLNGCATSQQEVARMLTRLRLMDGVSTVTLQSSTKATSGGGTASGNGCPPSGPVFSAQVTFDALPTPPATPSSSKTVSVSTTTATTTGATTP